MEIRYAARFHRDLEGLRNGNLNRQVEQLIGDLKAAANLLEIRGVERLTARGRQYRIRVGAYRVLASSEANAVTLLTVRHRRDAYPRGGRRG